MFESRNPPHVLLVQRNDVEAYPPVLHQAHLLGASSRITVIDAPEEERPSEPLTASKVRRLRVPTSSAPGLKGRIARVAALARFGAAFRRVHRLQPNVTVAYEPEAISLLLAHGRRDGSMRIAHLHETLELDRVSASAALSWSTKYVLRHLREADIVIVPDGHRADLLVNQAELGMRPHVVMNCPLLLDRLPQSRLLPFLRERGAQHSRIVHYQGAIGKDHALDHVIASMPSWPEDTVLVLVGTGPQRYLDQLRRLSGELGVAKRVFFVGRVPYDQLFSYAVGATVGLTLLEPSCQNWRYAAGASNKRFEYAALGVPQVTNRGPGIDALFVRPGIAEAVPPDDPVSIGQAITGYIRDPERAVNAGLRARRLHCDSYNYASQFEPVKHQMLNWWARSEEQRCINKPPGRAAAGNSLSRNAR